MRMIVSHRTAPWAGCALTALAAAAPLAAQAEPTQPAAAPTGAETPVSDADLRSDAAPDRAIIVTGSRIRRDPNDSPLPLQVITTQELERNGINNPEQLLAYLTTSGTAGDNLASNADVVRDQQRGQNGASFANLRSQGSGATLVLLNGRRVASHGLQGSAVDVNQIPFSAIERVEVLKEGASAIYGTDAIGGVINFILRKNYQGLSLNAFTDIAEEGDHTIYRVSATGGYGDLDQDGFNIMGTVSYSSIPELRANKRDFINLFQPDRGLSPDTRGTPFATIFPLAGTFFPNPASTPLIPGTTTRASGGINILDLPGGLGCGAVADQGPYDAELWATPSAAFACAWDTSRSASIQQELETVTYLGRGVVRLGEHEISAEVTGSDATSAKRFSEIQLFPGGISYPIGAPNHEVVYQSLITAFPELASRPRAPFSFRWRCLDCGRREITTDTQTIRYALGIEGPLFSGWDYRAGASYAQSESQSALGSGYYYRGTVSGAPDPRVPLVPGTANLRGLIGAVNSGFVNAFLLPGQSQSAAGLAAIQSASAEGVVLYGGRYSVTQVDASVSGPLFELPGGMVRAAFGVDYRKEKYRFNGDARAAADRPEIIGAPFDDGNALEGVSRDILAAYAEVLIPVFDGFELTGALRFDDYGDFGSTTNPLVNFKYRPAPWLMFRGNYNTAFRVPAFNQLFNGTTRTQYLGSDLADPATCAGGRPSTAPGCENLFQQIDTISGGNPDLGPETAEMYSLGLVVEPSPNFSASVDYFSIKREGTIRIFGLRQLIDNFAINPAPFIRENGDLVAIDQRWFNAGGTTTEGFEFVLRGGVDIEEGRLIAGLDGTLLTKRDEQSLVGGPVENRLGVFSFSGELGLRWKHNAFVGYRDEDVNVTLTQIYRNGYENQQLPGIANGTVTRPNVAANVDPYIIYNLQLTFTSIENMRFGVGVKNLFDTNPPFAISYDSATGGGGSWEPRVADPRGRAFTLLAEVRF